MFATDPSDLNVTAQVFKDDQSSKKTQVTITAKKLRNAVESKKDFHFIESVANELENFFYEFEYAHSEPSFKQ